MQRIKHLDFCELAPLLHLLKTTRELPTH